MTRFAIDLSALPFPGVIETLSYEALLAELKADLQARYPFADVESEPIVMLLQAVAYWRLIDRARINDAAKAVFVAYAWGADLDNLAAFFGVTRLTITPADPDASPPVVAVLEADAALRERVLLALEAQSAAGPRGAYLYFARSADPRVLDASVVGPSDGLDPGPPPGTVWVYVLGQGGATPPDLVTAVSAALNAEEVRPLCDTVVVSAATLVDFTVQATLTFYAGPDRALVLAAAQAAAAAYVAASFRLGRDVTRSGLFAALHQPGVQNVVIAQPAADLVMGPGEAARATAITLTDGGLGE